MLTAGLYQAMRSTGTTICITLVGTDWSIPILIIGARTVPSALRWCFDLLLYFLNVNVHASGILILLSPWCYHGEVSFEERRSECSNQEGFFVLILCINFGNS